MSVLVLLRIYDPWWDICQKNQDGSIGELDVRWKASLLFWNICIMTGHKYVSIGGQGGLLILLLLFFIRLSKSIFSLGLTYSQQG